MRTSCSQKFLSAISPLSPLDLTWRHSNESACYYHSNA